MMRGRQGGRKHFLWVAVGAAGLLVACAAGTAAAGPVVLSGSAEVPPVTTQASGIADVSIVYIKCSPVAGGQSGNDCPTAVGTVTTAGVTATAVHIHQAAAGQNGPVVVPLKARPGSNDTIWDVPPKSTVGQAVFEAWWSGNLYVNVHSAANPNGEIRAQLRR